MPRNDFEVDTSSSSEEEALFAWVWEYWQHCYRFKYSSTTPRQAIDATPTRSEQNIQNVYAVMKESSDDSSSCENDEVTDSEAESEENEGLSIDQD